MFVEEKLISRIGAILSPAPPRPIFRFAEEELVIPSGPHQGRRFRCDRNPSIAQYLHAVDASGLNGWRRFVATGPTQSGKTLTCFVLPAMYHLFELNETVIVGLPTLDMADDKWTIDLLPAIEASRYREFLPRTGPGSRSGSVGSRVQFANGATLRFMTGGGGDKARAGFTSRILIVTETDGMDESGGSSREADKISQLEGRTRAYGSLARTYMECTVSTETGRTWQEYTRGTQSRLALRCPHCLAYVTPEREHLIGWKDAEDIRRAAEAARLLCPACAALWDEADRHAANADARLVHRGQELLSDGTVKGEPPATDTLGFRWTAANNLLVDMSVIAQDEWRASREVDEANAETHMRQFVWALPHEPATVNLTQLDAQVICRRTINIKKGFVPAGTRKLTIGLDSGKRLCHWTLIAWQEHATPHVVEYGRLEVASDDFGEERALLATLRDFRDQIASKGWPVEGSDAMRKPDAVFCDAGWHQHVVVALCAESGPGWWPTKGIGSSQAMGRRATRDTGSKVVATGEGYDVVTLSTGAHLVELNADTFKSYVNSRLTTPLGHPGALTLHEVPTPVEHVGFAKHLTAEKKIEEFVAGRGMVTRWEAINRNNHWLDATAMACAAAIALGEVVVAVPQPPPPVVPVQQQQDEPSGGWQIKNW